MTPLLAGMQVEGLQVQHVLLKETNSITYRVVDPDINATFELKEYLPRDLCQRESGKTVTPIAGREADFEAGLAAFRQEGRMAAQLDHPSLRKTLRFLRANGTAYQLMTALDGRTLTEQLEEGPLPSEAARALLRTLPEGLQLMHGSGVIHQDITPDNIVVTDEDRPVLRGLNAEGFDGTSSDQDPFKAPEQLDPEGLLGPWTDIYGLAATLYQCLTGQAPPTASSRLAERERGNPDPAWANNDGLVNVTGSLLDSLRHGLQLDHEQRPADMDAWRRGFESLDWRLSAAIPDTDDEQLERKPWLPLTIAIGVGLVLVAIGAFLASDKEVDLGEFIDDTSLETSDSGGVRARAPTNEERERWQAAVEADTLLGYRRFLEDFPTSIYAEQAQLQINILDERAWTQLSTEDTRSAYEDYLKDFPTGLHQAEALQRIEAIDAEAARLERERVERERRDNEAWAIARESRTIDAMNVYIKDWPAGLHIDEARRILRELLDRQNDSSAFATAQQLDTKDAFKAYLDAFPRGAHVTEALKAIDRLTLSPGKPFRDCSVCPELRVMPIGAFRQGSGDADALALEQEKPQRVVTINQPFAVGIYEVTMGQWDACVAAGGCSTRPPDNGWGRGDRPVMMVSWNDVQEYMAWLSQKTGQVYRLPSESEWEYFARADEKGPWLGSSPEAVCAHGNIAGAETGFDWQHDNCEDPVAVGTVPVGAFKPNKAGLFDVIGNVAEWTADCLNLSYLDAPVDGSAWNRGICSSHMTRGGSWVTGTRDIRLPARFNLKNGDRNDFTGFRVLREINE